MKALVLATITGAALATSGCLKNESVTTVNQDGTAKVRTVVEMNLGALLGMMGGGAGGQGNPLGDPQELLRQMVRSMNPSIDAWTEAKAEVTNMGATKLTLGGYMKDFTASGDLGSMLKSAGGSSSLPVDDLPDMKMVTSTTDSDGNWVISMPGTDEVMAIVQSLLKIAAEKADSVPKEVTVTEEEVAAKMTEFRAQYAQFKPMVAMFAKDLSIRNEMVVGGEILECSVFEKSGSNAIGWSLTGPQLIAMLDQVVADEQLPKKVVALAEGWSKGAESPELKAAVRAVVEPVLTGFYGGAVAPKVVIKPGKPAFDYEAEVAKARSSMSPELKKLVEEAGQPEAGGEEPAPKKRAA